MPSLVVVVVVVVVLALALVPVPMLPLLLVLPVTTSTTTTATATATATPREHAFGQVNQALSRSGWWLDELSLDGLSRDHWTTGRLDDRSAVDYGNRTGQIGDDSRRQWTILATRLMIRPSHYPT